MATGKEKGGRDVGGGKRGRKEMLLCFASGMNFRVVLANVQLLLSLDTSPPPLVWAPGPPPPSGTNYLSQNRVVCWWWWVVFLPKISR